MTRRMLLGAGRTEADLRRLLRRRELVVVHPGVYVDHTGPLTWDQRAWAAVLHTWPAALDGASALAAAGMAAKEGDIHLVLAPGRKLVVPEGVRLRRVRRFDDRVQWNTSPPRLRIEEVVLDAAERSRTTTDCVAGLTAAVRSKRTTVPRLLVALAARRRFRGRPFVRGVLTDIGTGVHSVLEHGYLHRVERPHGLPSGERQVADRGPSGRIYRDTRYPQGVVVELDGRAHHDDVRSRDRDFDRDLVAAADGLRTVRLTYGQVFDRPCRTALAVAQVLDVTPSPCGPGCAAATTVSPADTP